MLATERFYLNWYVGSGSTLSWPLNTAVWNYSSGAATRELPLAYAMNPPSETGSAGNVTMSPIHTNTLHFRYTHTMGFRGAYSGAVGTLMAHLRRSGTARFRFRIILWRHATQTETVLIDHTDSGPLPGTGRRIARRGFELPAFAFEAEDVLAVELGNVKTGDYLYAYVGSVNAVAIADDAVDNASASSVNDNPWIEFNWIIPDPVAATAKTFRDGWWQPATPRVFVEGAWRETTAKSYRNGEWQ